MATIADVFIIESLRLEDERNNRFEGRRLAELLRLSGKNPKYFYFQSKNEIPSLLKLFELSKYRYLHVSCHASSTRVCTTNENLNYIEFSSLFNNKLKLKRIFFSACELGNPLFNEMLVAQNNKGMHSIIAPSSEIYFDHAAAIWGAFYVSVFSRNPDSMNGRDIESRIETLCSLFPVEFHSSRYLSKSDKWIHKEIKHKSFEQNVTNKTKGETILTEK